VILYTIGHGCESVEAFNRRLSVHHIAELSDVRSFPGSRRSPQFGKDAMPSWLNPINYRHCPDLGGRRKASQQPMPEDGWWRVKSFANYAGYSRTDEFQLAFDSLLTRSDDHNIAIMCGEPCWWRCHRRMISDMAVSIGVNVQHIMPNGTLVTHEMSEWLQQGVTV
jgi:uncharacterized protein (DUF488 family)